MKYRTFGRTGFQVSDMAHGLWGMSGWTGSEDKESLDALPLAVDLGCNFFDTAWAYGEGKSDGLLGKTLAAYSGSGWWRLRNTSHESEVAFAAQLQIRRCVSCRACFQICGHDSFAVRDGFD